MRPMMLGLALAAAACPAARAASDFPAVGILQEQLHARPGDVLPRAIVHRGRLFRVRYLGARALPNGIYAVMIRLEK